MRVKSIQGQTNNKIREGIKHSWMGRFNHTLAIPLLSNTLSQITFLETSNNDTITKVSRVLKIISRLILIHISITFHNRNEKQLTKKSTDINLFPQFISKRTSLQNAALGLFQSNDKIKAHESAFKEIHQAIKVLITSLLSP